MWFAIFLLSALAFGPVWAQSGGGQSAPSTAAVAANAAAQAEAPLEKPITCFTAREMNERVSRLRLFNPLVAMQTNARRLRADPLRTRLCRAAGDRLVYQLSLISRRGGSVMIVYVNAQNGRPLASPKN